MVTLARNPRPRPLAWPFAVVLAAALGAAACSHEEPPTPAVSPSVAEPEGARPPLSPAPPTASSAGGAPSAAPIASVQPSATSAPPAAPDAGDSASLPQTHDRPAASGPAFEARVAALWGAIASDDPDRAMPFFFPLGAYQQVKDVTDPAADWRHRLVAAYKRDIHALHARLRAGDGGAPPKFVAFDVPESRGRWVEPGEEWNKIGYYRVFGSRLRYEDASGEHAFEIKSLISWRGEWFVVHLSAI